LGDDTIENTDLISSTVSASIHNKSGKRLISPIRHTYNILNPSEDDGDNNNYIYNIGYGPGHGIGHGNKLKNDKFEESKQIHNKQEEEFRQLMREYKKNQERYKKINGENFYSNIYYHKNDLNKESSSINSIFTNNMSYDAKDYNSINFFAKQNNFRNVLLYCR